ncbi:hypothetical protein [Bacillus phage vB_BanS-Thrax3]|nr:hypothetical protein [Bacillus phage vB_BanS-Thrax3]
MSFLNKLKKMFIEEDNEDFLQVKGGIKLDKDSVLTFAKLQKEPEIATIPVQLNGYYQYSINEYTFGNFFYIYVHVHGTINCEVDGFKISTPVHYKINVASGRNEVDAYENLLQNGEDFMDELKIEIIDELKEILRNNNIQGIKEKIENGGKVRLDIVLDIDKDSLEK